MDGVCVLIVKSVPIFPYRFSDVLNNDLLHPEIMERCVCMCVYILRLYVMKQHK